MGKGSKHKKAQASATLTAPSSRRVKFPDGYYICTRDSDQQPRANAQSALFTRDNGNQVAIEFSLDDDPFQRRLKRSRSPNPDTSHGYEDENMRAQAIAHIIRQNSQETYDYLKGTKALEDIIQDTIQVLQLSRVESMPGPSEARDMPRQITMGNTESALVLASAYPVSHISEVDTSTSFQRIMEVDTPTSLQRPQETDLTKTADFIVNVEPATPRAPNLEDADLFSYFGIDSMEQQINTTQDTQNLDVVIYDQAKAPELEETTETDSHELTFALSGLNVAESFAAQHFSNAIEYLLEVKFPALTKDSYVLKEEFIWINQRINPFIPEDEWKVLASVEQGLDQHHAAVVSRDPNLKAWTVAIRANDLKIRLVDYRQWILEYSAKHSNMLDVVQISENFSADAGGIIPESQEYISQLNSKAARMGNRFEEALNMFRNYFQKFMDNIEFVVAKFGRVDENEALTNCCARMVSIVKALTSWRMQVHSFGLLQVTKATNQLIHSISVCKTVDELEIVWHNRYDCYQAALLAIACRTTRKLNEFTVACFQFIPYASALATSHDQDLADTFYEMWYIQHTDLKQLLQIYHETVPDTFNREAFEQAWQQHKPKELIPILPNPSEMQMVPFTVTETHQSDEEPTRKGLEMLHLNDDTNQDFMVPSSSTFDLRSGDLKRIGTQ